MDSPGQLRRRQTGDVDLIAAVGDVDNVTATIDPDSIVTRAVVEQLIAGATVKREITIPATGWDVGAEEGAEGSFYVDIPQGDVTEEMVPVISVVPTDMETAKECGLCSAARDDGGQNQALRRKGPDRRNAGVPAAAKRPRTGRRAAEAPPAAGAAAMCSRRPRPHSSAG